MSCVLQAVRNYLHGRCDDVRLQDACSPRGNLTCVLPGVGVHRSALVDIGVYLQQRERSPAQSDLDDGMLLGSATLQIRITVTRIKHR